MDPSSCEESLWTNCVRHANGRGCFVEKTNQMRGERHRRVSCEKAEAKMPFNQEDRQYHGMARTIADVNDNVNDRAPTIVPPTTTRPVRQRRPPIAT
ncbi:hypothetical protein RB195_022907 [Necator americanus]|uniref:Uncharacterized protein n=1 Tax=Necator americanus TaxID=51031 RepID=A0ABR1EH12_NECAM